MVNTELIVVGHEFRRVSFVPTHDMFSFRDAPACHPEPVEGSRGEDFAYYASTGSA